MSAERTLDYSAFVATYLETGDHRLAAKAAGSKAINSSLSNVAEKMLKKASIIKMMAAVNDKIASDGVTVKRGARLLKMSNEKIATLIERQEFWTAAMRDTGAEYRDRIKASEVLGKAQGDFIKRIEISTSLDDELISAMKAARGRVAG
jgi:hypothetical protein